MRNADVPRKIGIGYSNSNSKASKKIKLSRNLEKDVFLFRQREFLINPYCTAARIRHLRKSHSSTYLVLEKINISNAFWYVRFPEICIYIETREDYDIHYHAQNLS